MNTGHLQMLTRAGARIHQAGCNGCIGMGQAPATGQISLRTVPRNFPGRSGTKEDAVYLVSPETAAASALTGEITDPRDLEARFGMTYPNAEEPDDIIVNTEQLVEPPSAEEAKHLDLEKGPNVVSLPEFDALPDDMTLPVLLKMGDDISTDEIMPAGSRILPYRSNIPKISEFVFEQVDESFFERSQRVKDTGHAIVAGTNYGQGSSREHAAIAPRWLGTRVKLVKSFARIHRQNLANFGILPLMFQNDADYASIDQGDELRFTDLRNAVQSGTEVEVTNVTKGETYTMEHDLSEREIEMVLEGSQVGVVRKEFADERETETA
jgi:aconitate hydratase